MDDYDHSSKKMIGKVAFQMIIAASDTSKATLRPLEETWSRGCETLALK